MHHPLSILYAGRSVTARLLDGRELTLAVRALPQRFLVRVLETAEFNHALVELCSYLPKDHELAQAVAAPMFPDIPAPAGLVPLPQGFCDNLDDASIAALYDAAKALNFQRAVDWAQGQIAAKKLVAPVHQAVMAQVMPLVDNVLQPLLRKLDALSSSTPSAPSSSAAPAKAS